jgi:hypothetical protein
MTCRTMPLLQLLSFYEYRICYTAPLVRIHWLWSFNQVTSEISLYFWLMSSAQLPFNTFTVMVPSGVTISTLHCYTPSDSRLGCLRLYIMDMSRDKPNQMMGREQTNNSSNHTERVKQFLHSYGDQCKICFMI